MENSDLDLLYFLRLFRKREKLIAVIIGSCLAVFLALYAALPKKYKSSAQITIYSKYFQNPLVKDFISEQYDPSEMRSQREALLQQAIDDSFLDEIGNEFKLYRFAGDTARHSAERAELRRQFETFGLSADSYEISFSASSPQLARDVAKRALERVIKTLVEHRRKTIIDIRNAIRARMEAMVLFMNTGPGSLGSTSRSQIEAQLAQIQAEISSLSQQYTERHPKIVQLRSREKVLRQYLAKSSSSKRPKGEEDLPPTRVPPETLAGSEIEPGSKEVYQDLLKKYNYLNVALDMEQADEVNYFAVVAAPSLPASAISPKLLNFLSYGLGAGVLLALFILLFDEYVKFHAADAEKKAQFWGIPLLGSVPPMDFGPESPLPEIGSSRKHPNDWN
jgi:hypothetical protein